MRLIDLTMNVGIDTPVFPGDPSPEFNQVAYCSTDGYNEHRICTNTHFGTHMDSPWHMLDNGKRLTDFTVDKFVGHAVLVDVRGQKEIDCTLEGIRQDDIVIFRTDHTKYASQPSFYENNPVICMDLAEKLVNLGVKMVGIDSFTPDNHPYQIHKILLGHEILLIENLVNLDELPTNEFVLYALPTKYHEIDGAPCRVIAQI